MVLIYGSEKRLIRIFPNLLSRFVQAALRLSLQIFVEFS
jgi:hypothetical protein